MGDNKNYTNQTHLEAEKRQRNQQQDENGRERGLPQEPNDTGRMSNESNPYGAGAPSTQADGSPRTGKTNKGSKSSKSSDLRSDGT